MLDGQDSGEVGKTVVPASVLSQPERSVRPAQDSSSIRLDDWIRLHQSDWSRAVSRIIRSLEETYSEISEPLIPNWAETRCDLSVDFVETWVIRDWLNLQRPVATRRGYCREVKRSLNAYVLSLVARGRTSPFIGLVSNVQPSHCLPGYAIGELRDSVVMLKPVKSERSFRGCFSIEEYAHLQLQHSAFMHCLGATVAGSSHFLAFQPVKGRLDLWLPNAFLTVAERIALVRQLFRGVCIMHHKQVQHRSLMPSSLFVDESGQLRIGSLEFISAPGISNDAEPECTEYNYNSSGYVDNFYSFEKLARFICTSLPTGQVRVRELEMALCRIADQPQRSFQAMYDDLITALSTK